MRKITSRMIKIYGLDSGLDWMNYKINKDSVITYHHINKCCDGGCSVIDNGALLITTSHQYLHIIERFDLATYDAINTVFYRINKQGYEPTYEQRSAIEYLLCNFEYRNMDIKNGKGNKLLRKEFLDRGFY